MVISQPYLLHAVNISKSMMSHNMGFQVTTKSLQFCFRIHKRFWDIRGESSVLVLCECRCLGFCGVQLCTPFLELYADGLKLRSCCAVASAVVAHAVVAWKRRFNASNLAAFFCFEFVWSDLLNVSMHTKLEPVLRYWVLWNVFIRVISRCLARIDAITSFAVATL